MGRFRFRGMFEKGVLELKVFGVVFSLGSCGVFGSLCWKLLWCLCVEVNWVICAKVKYCWL